MTGGVRKASLGAIFGVVALDLIGFGILIPQLGIYGVKFKASPFEVGLLLSSYSLMQLVFSPILGRLSDRVGRRPVLLVSVMGSMLGYLLFALSQSLPLLFLSRVIDGISGANIATAQAYVSDVTTPENRAKGMGLVGAAFGLGFVLGPAIGGFLGAWGGNFAIGLFAAGLTFLNFLTILFWLPESLPKEKRGQVRRGDLLGSLKLPTVGYALALFLLVTMAFSAMEGTFSVFLLARHIAPELASQVRGAFDSLFSGDEPFVKEASLKAGYLFAAIGLASAVVQGGLIGRLKRTFGEARLVVAGAAVIALGMFLFPAMPTYGAMFLPAVLLALGNGLCNPSLSALVSLNAPPERQGEVLGAYQAMGSMGRVLGPAMGGLLFNLVDDSAPYLVAGVMMMAAAVMALRLPRTSRHAAP